MEGLLGLSHCSLIRVPRRCRSTISKKNIKRYYLNSLLVIVKVISYYKHCLNWSLIYYFSFPVASFLQIFVNLEAWCRWFSHDLRVCAVCRFKMLLLRAVPWIFWKFCINVVLFWKLKRTVILQNKLVTSFILFLLWYRFKSSPGDLLWSIILTRGTNRIYIGKHINGVKAHVILVYELNMHDTGPHIWRMHDRRQPIVTRVSGGEAESTHVRRVFFCQSIVPNKRWALCKYISGRSFNEISRGKHEFSCVRPAFRKDLHPIASEVFLY